MSKLRDYLYIITFSTAPFIFLKIGTVNLVVFDILLLIVAVLTVFKNFNLSGNYKYYYMFSLLFLIFAWLSIYNSTDPSVAIATTLQYSFILVILFPTVGKILEIGILKRIVHGMSWTWCLFSIYNLTIINDPYFLWGGGAGRFVSYFSEPGELGVITAIMTPFMLYTFSSTFPKRAIKRFVFRGILLLGLVANFIMLNASGSRSGIIALIIGLLVLFIMRYGISIRAVFISSVFIFSSILITSFLSFERNALSRLTTSENLNSRVYDYQLVYDMLTKYYFVGSGLGASGSAIQDFGGVYRPHNMFLNILTESGFVGLFSIVVILIISLFFGLRITWNVLFYKKRANFLVATIFSSGIILLVYQQFNTVANHRGYWLIWAICLWMSTQKEFFYLDKKRKSIKNRRRIVWSKHTA